jgi:hypothetical protein
VLHRNVCKARTWERARRRRRHVGPSRTSPYTHAEAGRRPVVRAPCRCASVHNICGSPGRATRRSPTGRARRPPLAIGLSATHVATALCADAVPMPRPTVRQPSWPLLQGTLAYLSSPPFLAQSTEHRRVPPLPPPTSSLTHSRCLSTLIAPPLRHHGASGVAHCLAQALTSPDFEHPRPHRQCSTATARRRRLRPSHHCQ